MFGQHHQPNPEMTGSTNHI